MAPNDPLPDNSQDLQTYYSLCRNSIFITTSQKPKGRDFKLLPMSLVHLEAPSIYAYQRDLRTLLAIIAPESFLSSSKTVTAFL